MKTIFFASMSAIPRVSQQKQHKETPYAFTLSPAPATKPAQTHVRSRFHLNRTQQPLKPGQRKASQPDNTATARNRKQESHELFHWLSFARRMLGVSQSRLVTEKTLFASCQCSVVCNPWEGCPCESLPLKAACSAKGARTQIQCYSIRRLK